MTLDLGDTADLERWLDDAIRQRTEAHLAEALQRIAGKLYDRAQRYSAVDSGPSEIRDYVRADEVREPVTAHVDFDATGVAFLLAEALEHAAESPLPPTRGLATELVPVAPFADLPATLPELRMQSLSTEEAAARLGVNSSRVRQRLLARTLYGFKDGAVWRIPSFQFEAGRTVPGVEQVFPEIRPSVSPIAVARWFCVPWADLIVDEARETVVSPRTWLLEGRDPAPVVAQARVI